MKQLRKLISLLLVLSAIFPLSACSLRDASMLPEYSTSHETETPVSSEQTEQAEDTATAAGSTSAPEPETMETEELTEAETAVDSVEVTSSAIETDALNKTETASDSVEVTSSAAETEETVHVTEYSTNIKYSTATSQIESLLANLAGLNISVYYEDLNTGEFFAYNENAEYCFQSVTKAFYVDYMYNKLPEVVLSGYLEMTEAARIFAYYGGVAENENGTHLDISYLIEMAITVSDAVAYNILFDAFGVDGFNSFAESKGSDFRLFTSRSMGRFSYGSVLDAAPLLRSIWDGREDTSANLIELMQNCTFNGLLSSGAGDYAVAHKYGYGGEDEGVNDAAIIFTDSPFMLIVMSYIPGTANSLGPLFGSISSAAVKINETLRDVRMKKS